MNLTERIKKRITERQNVKGSSSKYILDPDVTFFTPKKGINEIDIIPYKVTVENHPEGIEVGDLWYQRTVFVHYGIGLEDQSYICPRTIRKPCPICEHRLIILKDENADKSISDHLKAKERELYNVVDLSLPERKVQLWEISYHNFGRMLEEEIREGNIEWARFPSLTKGYTLRVRFTEKTIGSGKTYLQATRVDFVKRQEQYTKEILKQVYDLDRILNVLPYKELERLFFEGTNNSGSDNDVDKFQDSTGIKKTITKDTRMKPQVVVSRNLSRKIKDEENEEGIEEKTEEDEEEKETAEQLEDEEENEGHENEDENEDENEGEDEDEEEKETPKAAGKQKQISQKKCPYGHKFGQDVDTTKDCVDCKVWEDCLDAAEE